MKFDMKHIISKSVSLMGDETISLFTTRLNEAGKKFLGQNSNLSDKNFVTLVEATAKTAVFLVDFGDFKYKPKYFAMKYDRKDNGDFVFSSKTEVERVVRFEPKPTTAVTQKEQWSTAFINDLPDAAFAAISPGGEKDKSGKTTPRSLRHLPHHNASVKSPSENSSVDLPHLRNALARLDQAKIPEDLKSRARRHLERHAKALLSSQSGDSAVVGKNVLKSLDDLLISKAVDKSAGGGFWVPSNIRDN